MFHEGFEIDILINMGINWFFERCVVAGPGLDRMSCECNVKRAEELNFFVLFFSNLFPKKEKNLSDNVVSVQEFACR